MIRDVKTEDSKEIVDIYNYYIDNTAITFETEKIDYAEMENRIKKNILTLLVSIITAQMKKVKKFIKNSDLKKLEY